MLLFFCDLTLAAAVYRILLQMFTVGLFDHPNFNSRASNVTSEEHNDLARRLSAASTALLKNSDVKLASGRKGPPLPLQKQGQKIAFIGHASDTCFTHSGGSGSVVPSRIVTPLQGAMHKIGSDSSITYIDGNDIGAAVAVAKAADVAVVFAGTTSSEGSDRANLNLDGNLDALIAAVAAAQPNTVAVLSVPGAIVMPWLQVRQSRCGFCSAEQVTAGRSCGCCQLHAWTRGPPTCVLKSLLLLAPYFASGRQRHRRRFVRRRKPVCAAADHHACWGQRPEVLALAVRFSAIACQSSASLFVIRLLAYPAHFHRRFPIQVARCPAVRAAFHLQVSAAAAR